VPPLRSIEHVAPNWVSYRGRKLLFFSGTDYFRLSWHVAIRREFVEAVGRYGPSSGASRLTTGNLSIYGELETEIARFFGVEAAVSTSSGYLAPLVAVQALSDRHRRVLLDERAHPCLEDAAAASRLPLHRFDHRDLKSFEAACFQKASKGPCLVMTDGLFTQSGEVAPLNDYLRRLPKDATLLVDDAHGAGVLGRNGRGTAEWLGVALERLVITMTFSKALGGHGGAILARRETIDAVVRQSVAFAGSSPVPPPFAASGLAALRLMKSEGNDRRGRLSANTHRVKNALRDAGYSLGAGPGPMFSIVPANAKDAERLRRRLLAAGIYPPLISYPKGPANQFFRFAISSEHSSEHLTQLIAALT
jgi:8-amino-7-oxononanoate synthase